MQIDLQEIRKFGNLDLLARQLVDGFITGLHKSPYHGFSVEFAEHKLYNPGESVRNIDWKLFARTDRLYVKRFEEETNLRCQIIIDTSSSMYYPEKIHGKIKFSILSAAALMYLLQKQRDAFGLTTFSERIEIHIPPKSTSLHFRNLCVEMDKLIDSPKPASKTGAASLIHQIADKIQKRSLVVIFSDMMDNMDAIEELFSSLQHLRHNHHEVLLFHVHDKKTELDFDYADKPYRFRDLETQEELKIQIAEVKEQYRLAMGTYVDELKMRAGQYLIDFIDADIEQGYEQILIPYLVKRAKMA